MSSRSPWFVAGVNAIIDELEKEVARKKAHQAREEIRQRDKKIDGLYDLIEDLEDDLSRARYELRDVRRGLRQLNTRVSDGFTDLKRRVIDLEEGRARRQD